MSLAPVWTRGDLDRAEEIYRKALAIDEMLGRLEGMAADYGNLGGLYEQRGDMPKAREHWLKSRDLYRKLGSARMTAKVQSLLDALDA